MANPWSRVLYTGVTSDLQRRVSEHKSRETRSFTARYNVTALVYFEEHANPTEAIAREKQVKAWTRAKRVALIATKNPEFLDLAATWATE